MLNRLIRLKDCQNGVAAVEFAIVLPLLIAVIGLSVFFGKVFMYYTVAQKSAQAAANYLASIPKSEMASPARAEAHVEVAEWLVDEMMGDIKQGNYGNAGVQIQCDGRLCGFGVPKKITVVASVLLFDEYFTAWTAPITGSQGVVLDANSSMTYVGQ